MGTARPSVTKRQREQVKRERQARKAEKRAQRKLNGSQNDEPEVEPVGESEPEGQPVE